MGRILVVEDDPLLAASIVDALKAERHVAESAHDGMEAGYILSIEEFDLIVLDWDLPKKNGIQVLKEYRARSGATPVLMLTGKSDIANKEEGLYSGADDYLTKPFEVRELIARVAVILRRSSQSSQTPQGLLSVGNLTMDPVKYKLTRDGEELHLARRDFALLEFFMRNPDQVFSTQSILSRLYGFDSEGTVEGLRSAIRRVRKVVDVSDDPTESLIENVARVGYKLRRPGGR